LRQPTECGGRVQLRRARCLFVYWKDDRLFFHNFARRLTVSARPITWEVLAFFNKWRTSQEAVIHFVGYTPKSVISALSKFVKQGLLLVKDSGAALQDSRLAKEWSSWLPEASFHFSTKDTAFITKLSVDQWKAILPKTPPPKIFKTVKGPTKRLPPVRAFPDSEFIRVLKTRKTHRRFSNQEVTLEAVSHLLSLVWGVTDYLYSPVFCRLLQKTSPSGGARHPGEVYVMALHVKGLNPGLYHYHPAYHHLKRISTNATRERAWLYCARQDHVRNASALFVMTAIFRRTMWKYDVPRAYRAVLLDAGHLCQTFCLVATWLGLAPFCTAALKDTLIEEDLRIDGIRESVLYVAGIGCPAIGEHHLIVSPYSLTVYEKQASKITLAQVRKQFSRSADHSEADRTSGRAGAARRLAARP
jgi:SagB-type dehydrogenase family enzyme